MKVLKLAVISTLLVVSTSWAQSLTGPQKNAVRSAKQYLSMQGFSRDGLIHQLSAEYGDGYKVADATVAVDGLDVDWNKQAARSAEQYLSMQGFSGIRNPWLIPLFFTPTLFSIKPVNSG